MISIEQGRHARNGTKHYMALTTKGEFQAEEDSEKAKYLCSFIQVGTKMEEWILEDAEIIQQHHHNIFPKTEMEATILVHQNLIKQDKLFGVDFQGHEEEAL